MNKKKGEKGEAKETNEGKTRMHNYVREEK